MEVGLESSTSENFTSITDEPLQLVTAPLIKFWFGNDYITLTAQQVFGGGNIGFNGNKYRITVNTSNIADEISETNKSDIE